MTEDDKIKLNQLVDKVLRVSKKDKYNSLQEGEKELIKSIKESQKEGMCTKLLEKTLEDIKDMIKNDVL